MINLEKFDNLNIKLLDKLNEDYSLLSESKDGDPFSDSNTEKVLNDKIQKEENDTKEAFYNAQQVPDENVKTKAILEKDHAKSKIAWENTKNLKRKLKLVEELNIDNYSDEDFYFMAEEFNNDAKDNMINKKKKMLEKKLEDIKAESEEKINKINADKEEKMQDADEENNIASNQLQMQQDSANQTMSKNSDKKIESINKSAESKTNNIQRQWDKLDNMQNRLQDQSQAMQEGWIKNMKKAIAERKMDKLSKKEGDLVIKRRKIEDKMNKAAEKGHEKKVEKFKDKIEKIDNVIDKIHNKFRKYDQKLVKLEESFLDDIDLLCIEADNLIESIELDPDYLEEEYAYNSLYQQYKDIIEYNYTDPMKIKLVKEIKSEFEKDTKADVQKIKILIMKLKQYK